MKLGTKILGGFLLVVALLALVAVTGYRGLSGANTQRQNLEGFYQLDAGMAEVVKQERGFLINDDEKSAKLTFDAIEALLAECGEMAKQVSLEDAKQDISELESMAIAFQDAFQNYVTLSNERKAIMSDIGKVTAELD